MVCTCTEHINHRLIYHIRRTWNPNEIAAAKLMLNENPDLAYQSDCRGTLLHFAATVNNADIIRYLIDMGSPVNSPGPGAKTPLMMAVEHSRKSAVRVLLEAGADIDIVDAKNESALYKALNSTEVDFKVVEAVLLRAKAEIPTTQELIEKLLAAGCSFPHFALLREVGVLEELLRWEFDIELRNHEDRTVLHFAALAKDFESTRLLIDRGANVNARDNGNVGPLYYATRQLDQATMKLLLDHGADADPRDVRTFEYVPLYACLTLVEADGGHEEPVRECAELLLQYGAFPQDASGPRNLVFQIVGAMGEEILEGTRLNCLVAYQAMLDLRNEEKCEESRGNKVKEQHLTEYVELKAYYDKCRQVLNAEVVGTISLLELLNGYSDSKMRFLARNSEFAGKVEQFCMEPALTDHFSYYANTLSKRIGIAGRIVKLEIEGISIISDIFNCNYNQLIIFARRVVGYLSESDLEQLCYV